MSDFAVEREHRVSPLELFFDLVFVFAFTEVTTLWLEQQTWGGLGRGLLVLVALWWVWASFAWLTNAADADAGIVTVVVLGAMVPLFIAALAVPEAFGAHRLAFGLAFFAVAAAFVALFVLVSKERPEQLAAVLRLAPIVLAGAGLVVVAAFVPSSWRPVLWALALAVGFVGPQAQGVAGWQVEPGHFAERHGLIVIIAIGESLGAIGFGARNSGLGAGVVGATVLGLVGAASFWLAYFDFASRSLQRRVETSRGIDRVALARDAYTYAHLPMVVGIILFAFGMRATLVHVHAHLHAIPALALCCGSAVYLLGFVALRWRVSRSLGKGRPVAAVVFAGLTAVATSVPALAAVALVASVWLALHTYELITWREERARQRAATLDAVVAPE